MRTGVKGAALIVALALMGGAVSAQAADRESAAALRAACARSVDCRATSRYYDRLISTAAPNGAELSLFANLIPKGGDLHHHYSGAIYAETFLDWVREKKYCIYAKDGSDVGRVAQKFHIETDPASLPGPLRAICISADEAMTRKDGERSFYRELLMRWSDKDYRNHYHEQNPPDQQFFDTFGYFGPVSGYSYHDGLLALKARAIAENMQYLETQMKSAPNDGDKKMAARLDALSPDAGDVQVDAVLAAYAGLLDKDGAFQARIRDYVQLHRTAVAGIDDAAFQVRFQSYVARNMPRVRVFSGLYAAYAAARQAPDLIVGVNIVSPENGAVSMRDYDLQMKMFRFLNRRFPGVKLSLHAGELVLGMVPPEGLRHHIGEAVEVAGAKRIGHGVDIAHEDHALALLARMRRDKIAVEINLTSNAFILGVKPADHPVQLYHKFKVPFVISSDDEGVSRNNLSGEYAIFMKNYKPHYAELKEVVYNSIRYSFLSERDKAAEYADLHRRFAAFEKEMAENLRAVR